MLIFFDFSPKIYHKQGMGLFPYDLNSSEIAFAKEALLKKIYLSNSLTCEPFWRLEKQEE